MLGIGIGVNRLTGLLDVIPLPNTITITGEPNQGTLTTATAGQTYAELLALIDEGAATTDGPGSVTITATLLGDSTDPVQGGQSITGVYLLYTATEAPSVPRNIVFDPAITVGAEILATVQPVQELWLDGQNANDLTSLPTYLNPANWTSPTGDPITVSSPTVTRTIGEETNPSTMFENMESGEEIRITFIVSDGTLSKTITIDYDVWPVPTVATAGTENVSVDLDTGLVALPLSVLFEPSQISPTWLLPNNISLVGSPSGTTIASDSVLFDTDILAAQTSTAFTVRATDSVTVNGVTTVRTADKPVSLTATANVIGINTAPTLVQGFAGGDALTDSNRDTLELASNYTGVTTPNFVVRLRVNNGPVEILTYQWQTSDVAELIVDVYNNSGTPGVDAPDATFKSSLMTVQQLLTLSATSGTSVSVDTNVNAPDTYPVQNVIINGRDVDAGLTVVDFESAQMELIQSPLFVAPNGTALSATTTYTPPTIVVPTGSVVTTVFDLIDTSDDSVILSDVSITGDYDQNVTAPMQGVSTAWRATFTSSGLTTLIVDSPAIAVDAAAATVWDTTIDLNGSLSVVSRPAIQPAPTFTVDAAGSASTMDR